MPLVILLGVSLAAFSRINFGVHYPSDAVAGAFMGLVYVGLGCLCYELSVMGCQSCSAPMRTCYSYDQDSKLHFASLDRLSLLVFFIGVALSCLIYAMSVVPPVDFWKKCDLVFGMLLPPIVFQVSFLCPSLASPRMALPPPLDPTLHHFLWAACFASLATVVGLKLRKQLKFGCFALVYTITLMSLASWRLWVQ